MAGRKRRSPNHEPGVPPEPEPTGSLPGPGIPPEPGPPEPRPPRPGEPIPRQTRGLVDPRHARPAPAGPSQEAGPLLEVEPLSGPTEVSAETPPPAEPGNEGWLIHDS